MNGSGAIVQSLLQAEFRLKAGVSGDLVMSIPDALDDFPDRLRWGMSVPTSATSLSASRLRTGTRYQ